MEAKGDIRKIERDSQEWEGFLWDEKSLNFLIWVFYRAMAITG